VRRISGAVNENGALLPCSEYGSSVPAGRTGNTGGGSQSCVAHNIPGDADARCDGMVLFSLGLGGSPEHPENPHPGRNGFLNQPKPVTWVGANAGS